MLPYIQSASLPGPSLGVCTTHTGVLVKGHNTYLIIVYNYKTYYYFGDAIQHTVIVFQELVAEALVAGGESQ